MDRARATQNLTSGATLMCGAQGEVRPVGHYPTS